MKKFTLLEILVVGTITILVIAFIYGAAFGKYNVDSEYDYDYTYLNPQVESAKNSRKIAEQLERQNDLMEQQLQQKAEKDQ